MIDSRNAWRRRIGCMTLAALLASAALAQSPDAPPAGFENGPDIPHGGFPPPPDGARNREQGVVLLKVLVGADGAARKVEVDPDNKASPELTKAASDAALKWHYLKQENAKSSDAWVKVPVRYSLSLLPPHPPGPPHGGEMPPPPPPGSPMPPPPATQPPQSSSSGS